MAGNFPSRIVLLAGSIAGVVALAASNSSFGAVAGTRPGPLPAVFALLAGHPSGQQVPRGQRHEYRHEIEQMEESWRNATLKANGPALAALLADDYTGITAKGAIQTKEQAVNNLKTGAFQISALTFSDRKIRVYGSTAVVTSTAELTGGKNDLDVTGRYRYTRVYVRNLQGQWKIVSFEASRVQESNEHK